MFLAVFLFKKVQFIPLSFCRGGEIERIFGAALRRVKTDDGWQYYCVAKTARDDCLAE